MNPRRKRPYDIVALAKAGRPPDRQDHSSDFSSRSSLLTPYQYDSVGSFTPAPP